MSATHKINKQKQNQRKPQGEFMYKNGNKNLSWIPFVILYGLGFS